jgi:hypothetical protein
MSFPIGPVDASNTRLVFALLLRDRLTLADALLGAVGVAAGQRPGWRKGTSGTFLFFDLPNGSIDLAVRSGPDTPYYLPTDITVTLPPATASWPAFPDIGLADKTLPLSDPGQPAAYRAQFLQACLAPSIAYPFDPAATLVRGTVQHAGAPVANVTISSLNGNTLDYVTGADGQFVLVFQQPPLLPTSVTIRAHRSGSPDVDLAVDIRRAVTTTTQFDL